MWNFYAWGMVEFEFRLMFICLYFIYRLLLICLNKCFKDQKMSALLFLQ